MAACKETPKQVHSPSKYVGDGPFRTAQERQEFFQKQGVQYTSKLLFSEGCQDLGQVKPEDYVPYAANKAHYDQLTAKYGACIQKGRVADVAIRWVSAEVGYGVFAAQDFAPDDFVVEYTGEVVESVSDTVYTFTYPPGEGNIFNPPLRENYGVDAMHRGGVARFVNHSDYSNVKVEFVYYQGAWHILFLAKKNIAQGEQLLITYSSRYWSNRKKLDL